ncbi:malate synthase G, partial [Burkholderia sp. SIMBA_013]
YDALYGTDAIPATPGDNGAGYNPERGRAVIARARQFLDTAAPLAQGSHAEARGYSVENGQLKIALSNGATTLKTPSQFTG